MINKIKIEPDQQYSSLADVEEVLKEHNVSHRRQGTDTVIAFVEDCNGPEEYIELLMEIAAIHCIIFGEE